MKILEWILAVGLALVMALAALNKILSSEFRDTLSDSINLPGWFLILVGLLELSLAVDLLLPRFRILGGLGVAVVMVGAVVFNLFGETVDDNNPRLVIPLNIVLALVGLAAAWLAADRTRSLGTLLSRARSQAMGQVGAAAEAAGDIVS